MVHYADIVPHIPPASFGFLHQGSEIWYDKPMTTFKSCSYGESSTCSNSLPATSLSAGDHSMDIYITLPGSALDELIKKIEDEMERILLICLVKISSFHLTAE